MSQCGRLFLLRYVEPGFGALQGILGISEIVFCLSGLEFFFSAPFCFLRPADVDLIGPLGGLSQYRDLIRQNFGKSPGDREVVSWSSPAIGDLTYRRVR